MIIHVATIFEATSRLMVLRNTTRLLGGYVSRRYELKPAAGRTTMLVGSVVRMAYTIDPTARIQIRDKGRMILVTWKEQEPSDFHAPRNP